MKKSTHYLKVIEIFKERFDNFPLEKLRRLAKDGYLMNEARIAVRELIEEKEKLSSDNFEIFRNGSMIS